MTDEEAKKWVGKLCAAEKRLDFNGGFGFVYGPLSTLESADVAFLTLNPGRPPDGVEVTRAISNECGNAYELDACKPGVSPLAAQFLKFAEMIDRKPKKILTGVVAPFRSGNWRDLEPEQVATSLELGRCFWRGPLQRESLKLVVCCSHVAAMVASELIEVDCTRKDDCKNWAIDSGWGNTKIRVSEKCDKALVHLPHLSRYQLFSHEESKQVLKELFTCQLKGYLEVEKGGL
jgi:hypothetical protein